MSERHTESHLAAEAQQNLAQVVTAAGDDWRLIVVDAFEVVVVIVIVSVSVDVLLTILDSGQQSRLGRTLLSFGGIIIPRKIFFSDLHLTRPYRRTSRNRRLCRS
jgi:hypothetical protein